MSYYDYWGKTDKSDPSHYHLLPYHSLDVAAVGQQLLSTDAILTRELSQLLDINEEQLSTLVVFFIALHDLGKFTSAFQALSPKNTEFSANQYDASTAKHDRLGVYFWDQICDEVIALLAANCDANKKIILKNFNILMNVVLGHHGAPVVMAKPRSLKRFTESRNIDDVLDYVRALYDLLQPCLPKLIDTRRLEQASWHLAGITVLADWLGSNTDYFPYNKTKMPLSDYWQQAQQQASNALIKTGFSLRAKPSEFISIQHHFGFEPTPLQQWAQTVLLSDSPQLFVLEDVTGSGKTEAALALTHRLMAQGLADGFYFGLPTMATSNAMFNRVTDHYSNMFENNHDRIMPSIVLAQSSSALNDRFQTVKLTSGKLDDDYYQQDQTATALCNAWLADSRKKALLATVGVGTIDQALLAVLPRKHQSLRLLGLHRKVLIFDEVHAADEYMFTLLESLLEQHLHHGGSAILLTATLSTEQRQKLVNIWLKAGQLPPHNLTCTSANDFPLATQVCLDPLKLVIETPLKSRADVCREVTVTQLHTETACIETIVAAVKAGRCVAWIRNSVDDARVAYTNVKQALETGQCDASPEQIILFHSRFTLADRKRIESQVLNSLSKKLDDGTVIIGEQRQGKVLIATQVFQESLDADVDVMISDICPIDDLIQRAGRLHRHTRDINGQYYCGVDQRAAPVLYLHAPEWEEEPKVDWLSRDFRNTEYVYRSPGRLWLAQRKLIELSAIRMPSEARILIEAVYSEEARAQIPTALITKEDELIAEQCLKTGSAKSQLIDFQYGYCDSSQKRWSEDQYDISTRFCDRETAQILVLKCNENGELVPWQEDSCHAIALSTLSVAKLKYADHLQPLTEQQTLLLAKRYPNIKYIQPWYPEQDLMFGYSATSGFYQRNQ
ncbi:CRISPR-associated helicase Cas3' [Photobacterium iliopiscarium]|uniref:CRISPR-associated helicase Cas3' n=1 Tax=Photobacterium iliopiscarium TaxID=56192 RepID=UPI00242CB3A6|nr:CRISPR-associated helicase Cas3' [Photobacterium iliopiscarium]